MDLVEFFLWEISYLGEVFLWEISNLGPKTGGGDLTQTHLSMVCVDNSILQPGIPL